MRSRSCTNAISRAAAGSSPVGYLSYWPGRYDDAVRYAAESLAIAREIGDEVRTADALHLMGIASLGLGDIEPSRRYLEEAVALAKRAGDKETLSDALNSLAEVYSAAGELDLSQAVYEEALLVNRAAGARDFVTVNLINLARVAISRGAPARLGAVSGGRAGDCRAHAIDAQGARLAADLCRSRGDARGLGAGRPALRRHAIG